MYQPTRDTARPLYDGFFLGEVVDNDDPQPNLMRVRVRVPGLLDPESVWCYPIGSMFGVKGGVYWVPEEGSNVVVWLHQGDPQHPYYIAGPWGAPGGVADAPEQGGFNKNNVSVRWRNFHVTIIGEEGQEKFVLEDLDSGTKIEIDKTTGDFTRDVEGSESISVAKDRSVTVETGDETHSVLAGGRTTTIQQDDSETIVEGNKNTTVALGNETKTIGGNATETVAGTKALTAATVAISAAGAVTITGGGAVTIQGAGLSLTSVGAPTTVVSGGLLTETFLGGIVRTITGVVSEVFNGAYAGVFNAIYEVIFNGTFKATFGALAQFLGNTIQLGLGTQQPSVPDPGNPSQGYQRLCTEALVDYILTHTHKYNPGPGAPVDSLVPTQQAIPGNPLADVPDPAIVAPNVDRRTLLTQHVEGS